MYCTPSLHRDRSTEHGDTGGSRVETEEDGAAVIGRVLGQCRFVVGTGCPETRQPRFSHQRSDGGRARRGRERRRRSHRFLPSAGIRSVQENYFGRLEGKLRTLTLIKYGEIRLSEYTIIIHPHSLLNNFILNLTNAIIIINTICDYTG